MSSHADTNENMEVEDDVNKTLTEDKSEDEGEDTLKAVDSKFNRGAQISQHCCYVLPCYYYRMKTDTCGVKW